MNIMSRINGISNSVPNELLHETSVILADELTDDVCKYPARFEEPEPAKKPSSDKPVSTLPTFAGVDVADLEQYTDQEVDWIVDRVFSADQITVFGARSKAGKTTQLCDLAVALATKTKWLRHFEVPKQRRVLFLTGESNNRAIAKRLQRAANSRGLSLADLKGLLRVEAVEFPKLPSLVHCEAVQKTVEDHSIDVVFFDPLFRGMTADMDTNRLASVGDAIVQFAKFCQPASLVLSHHTTKSAAREYGHPPELEDMTGAGIAESCGNWWLLGRNEPYAWDWKHDLCVQFGGRDEQSGAKRIVFDEENWTFEVESYSDYIDTKQAKAEQDRQTARQKSLTQKQLQAKDLIKSALANQDPMSMSRVKALSSVHQSTFAPVFAEMQREQDIAVRPYRDSLGRYQTTGYILQSRVAEYDKRFAEMDLEKVSDHVGQNTRRTSSKTSTKTTKKRTSKSTKATAKK